MEEAKGTKFYEGLYRTSKYGKWSPFRVGVMNVELEPHELKKRVTFQIKSSYSDKDENLQNGKEIVEIKYDNK